MRTYTVYGENEEEESLSLNESRQRYAQMKKR
jgi:hypothetical protein